VSPELGRGSPWAGCDRVSVASIIRLCSGDGLFLSGGVIFRHFSLSLEASGLGGRLPLAVSGDVPTVEIAGLVRRRRRGPALIPF